MVCVVELRVERKLWLINKIGYIPQCHGIPAIVTRRYFSEKSRSRDYSIACRPSFVQYIALYYAISYLNAEYRH